VRRNLLRKYHIVIASRECGDIKALIAMGASPKRIIACDLDQYARMTARRLGCIVSPMGNIVATVEWAIRYFGRKNIASVNVDLCFGLMRCMNILQQVYACGLSKETKVFLTFCRNRAGSIANDKRAEFFRKHCPTQEVQFVVEQNE
jgi:hypothetical protein